MHLIFPFFPLFFRLGIYERRKEFKLIVNQLQFILNGQKKKSCIHSITDSAHNSWAKWFKVVECYCTKSGKKKRWQCMAMHRSLWAQLSNQNILTAVVWWVCDVRVCARMGKCARRTVKLLNEFVENKKKQKIVDTTRCLFFFIH